MSYQPSQVELDAISLIKNEKTEWGEMQTYLTENISFNCRNIIKRAKKNYFSIFDNPYDPITNRKKLYIPLTRDMVETTVKNIDIDTKDIGVKAKKPDTYRLAIMTRYILSCFLDKMRFGQILNRIIRRQSVEGVAVLKRTLTTSKVIISLLENLNFYTDPSANYLSESEGNIEDNWLTINEANQNGKWEQLDEIIGQTSIERTPNIRETTNIPYIQVTERWGLIPKSFLTTNPKDKNDYLEGVIIATGLDSNPVVQLIAENTSGLRPYKEFRAKTYDGRWLGLGIGEDLFDIQSYMNEVFNTRLNTNRIKQLGLFQIRKGSGITPQMLKSLYSGGGVQVSRIGTDIAELNTGDISPTSYKDEDQGYLWAQRMTGAWEIGRGENLPASQPATTAVLQDRGMKSGFSLQQEELGFSISQFIEELLLPSLFDTLKDGDIQRITGDPKELQVLDEAYIDNRTNEEIIKFHKKNGYYPSKDEIEYTKQKIRSVYRKQGKDRWINIKKKLFSSENLVDSIEVFVTGESFNKMVLSQQLNDLLLNYSNVAGVNIDSDKIVAEILDLMGLSSQRFLRSQEEIEKMQQQQLALAQVGQAEQAGQGPTPGGRPMTGLNAETNKIADIGTARGQGMAMVPSM
uniref:Portal protein n=1 Tax=viral metagenome TaxID=1070528 RepID=A0A6M3K8C6_9ZZZZ